MLLTTSPWTTHFALKTALRGVEKSKVWMLMVSHFCTAPFFLNLTCFKNIFLSINKVAGAGKPCPKQLAASLQNFFRHWTPSIKGHSEQLIVKTITRREWVVILTPLHRVRANNHFAQELAFDNSQNQTAENTNTENDTSKNTLHTVYSSVTSQVRSCVSAFNNSHGFLLCEFVQSPLELL